MSRCVNEAFGKGSKVPAVLVSAALAAVAVFSLSGCSGVFGVDGFAQRAEDAAMEAQELARQAEHVAVEAQQAADALSIIDYSKTSRLVVKDASTDEVVREITDQGEIERAFEPLSGTNGLASAPNESAQYILELWQPETLKAGQGESDLQEVKALEATVYEASSVVTLNVPPIGLVLHLDPQDGTADALRALAA